MFEGQGGKTGWLAGTKFENTPVLFENHIGVTYPRVWISAVENRVLRHFNSVDTALLPTGSRVFHVLSGYCSQSYPQVGIKDAPVA